MRPLYAFVKSLFKLPIWIYYPRYKTVNGPRKRFNHTIYMCNHSGSFMDPLVVASPQKPVVFFMTRGDIYKGFMKVVFWSVHMLPIYRKHDRGNTKDKNEEVFKTTSKLLSKGKNILIFAEGFTDNEFIRRLKPVKKGAVRMGFLALEEANWKENIYVQALGINYSDRNKVGSTCLLSYGNTLCLNGYRSEYERDSKKTVSKLTHLMELEMRAQITDVRNEEIAPFHENIMRLTKKGMSAVDSDKRIPLLERWGYSKGLATWFNENKVEDDTELMTLKSRIETYFEALEKREIDEISLYTLLSNQRNRFMDILYLILLAPFVLVGQVLTYLPVKMIKNYVEKTFKRNVFWSSVKMLLGMVAVGVYNFILLLIVAKLAHVSFLSLLLLGILVVPVTFVITRNWLERYRLHREMDKITKGNYADLAFERTQIVKEIGRLIPVA